MEPLFKSLVVGIVPRPTQIPPAPFRPEDLQRLYFDITRDHTYPQFQVLPADAGAQLVADAEDAVLLQPGLIQIQTKIELTPETATDKAMSILRLAFDRLKLGAYLQCGIKIVTHVAAPGAKPDAKKFVSEQLMRTADQAEDLGSDFFGGGVKFRRIRAEEGREDTLSIEPFIRDNDFIFVDYDVGRAASGSAFDNVEQVAEWLEEAFSFVRGPTISLLEA